MKKLTESIALDLNKKLILAYSPGEMIGIKDSGLLDSSLNRPFQTMFGESLYKDIFEKAVALFESLAKNHCFYNANKRTAFFCMTYFLFINGHVCVMNESKASDLTVLFVVGDIQFNEVVQTVRSASYHR